MYIVSHKFKGIFVTFWEASVYLLCASCLRNLEGVNLGVTVLLCPLKSAQL